MSSGSGQSAAANYIVHHLHHFSSSGASQTSLVDFSLLNWDTIVFSTVVAVLLGWWMRRAAIAATAGKPGIMVAAFEWLVEYVEQQASLIVKGPKSGVAPLAFCSLLWVVGMNSLDMLPVDLLPMLGAAVGIKYMRIVPTADLNATLALSIVVLFSSLYYGIRAKGGPGFVSELLSAPFGKKWVLVPFNLMMQVVEYSAKTISLGMRLFGNMFAGELVFMLIALLGGTAMSWAMGLHFLSGLIWSVFHILVVSLQGFIFMMLTLVYIGQACDHH